MWRESYLSRGKIRKSVIYLVSILDEKKQSWVSGLVRLRPTNHVKNFILRTMVNH